MKKIIRKLIFLPLKSISGKRRFQWFFEALHDFSMLGMNIGGGGDSGKSGEGNAIEHIRTKLPPDENVIVFDVGANVGNWSKMAYSKLALARTPIHLQLYAFEPSNVTFMKMQDNTKDIPNMRRLNFGFGSDDAELTLFSDKDGSGLASVHNRNLSHFGIDYSQREIVRIKTIDGFCEEHGIRHIHFLKLDVEGHELEVLKGAKNMLAANAIDFIQFEFGGCNIDSKTFFQDFWYLLKNKYKIYRIVRDGIFELKKYREQYELFTTTNFLAEKTTAV